MKPNDFIGRGWAFPVRIDNATADVRTASGIEDIEQAIRIVLGTRPGERAMRPDFGCGVHDMVFGGTDATTLASVERSVLRALVTYEPRIDVEEVSARASAGAVGELLVVIRYRVRGSNRAGNLTYPFYLQERV